MINSIEDIEFKYKNIIVFIFFYFDYLLSNFNYVVFWLSSILKFYVTFFIFLIKQQFHIIAVVPILVNTTL